MSHGVIEKCEDDAETENLILGSTAVRKMQDAAFLPGEASVNTLDLS